MRDVAAEASFIVSVEVLVVVLMSMGVAVRMLVPVMVIVSAVLGVVQVHAVGLDARPQGLPLLDARPLGRDFGQHPVQPGADAARALPRR